MVLKIATIAPEGTPWEKQLKQLKKRYEDASGGRIKVKLFFGGSLGGEKALVRRCYGGPDVLRIEDVEKPAARDGRVLVRVHAASVNPADWHFVRGVPYEISPANMIPYRGTERLWEAHDLIIKAWTSHDGPFNFEGRWFHHRQVNVWPRVWQQPHPPVWVTIGSGPTSVPVAQHKYVGAVFLAGYQVGRGR